jgi:hypothetical protein
MSKETILDGRDYKLSNEGAFEKHKPKSLSEAIAKTVGSKKFDSLEDVFKDVKKKLVRGNK